MITSLRSPRAVVHPLDKLEMHQPTRRVVDEHEQRALRTTILEPPVLAAVNLN